MVVHTVPSLVVASPEKLKSAIEIIKVLHSIRSSNLRFYSQKLNHRMVLP